MTWQTAIVSLVHHVILCRFRRERTVLVCRKWRPYQLRQCWPNSIPLRICRAIQVRHPSTKQHVHQRRTERTVQREEQWNLKGGALGVLIRLLSQLRFSCRTVKKSNMAERLHVHLHIIIVGAFFKHVSWFSLLLKLKYACVCMYYVLCERGI